ncbi:MAG: hypothetical protein QNJ01_04775 [Desulfobacterales bacterium]|nr:hypothetical protein [Desulfobacterales bacterium]
MAEDNRKTVIQSFQSEPQAHITQLHLVAMGIEAWTEKDDGGGAYPPLQFSNGVHVMVRAVEREEGAEAVKEKPAASPPVRGKAWQVFLVGMLVGTLIAAGVMSYRQHRANNDTLEAVFDSNSDALTDEIHFFEAGQLVRIHDDRNGDGKMDAWTFFPGGQLARAHSDDNFDGRVDAWFEYDDSYNYRVKADSNFDGLPDATSTVQHGVFKQADWHPVAFGRIERRIIYKNGVRAEQHMDTDGDGRFDITLTYDVFEREVSRRSYADGG